MTERCALQLNVNSFVKDSANSSVIIWEKRIAKKRSFSCSVTKMSAVRVRMKSAKNLDEDKNHNYLLRPSKLAANASKSPSMALLKRSKPVEKVPEARKKKIKVDEKKVNDPTEVCDQQFDKSSEEKTPTAVNLKNLKNILTDAYCDISARLKLPHPPKCVFNLQNCFTQHFHKDVSFACIFHTNL